MGKEKILEIKGLKTHFFTDEGIIKAVDGVDFEIYAGETLAIVGESGSGKTITSLSIMQLIPQPQGKIVEGEILYKERNLVELSNKEMMKIRGNEISMIFQEPMTSLNPVYTIGDQISEAIMTHKKINKNEAKDNTIEILNKVGFPEPERRLKEYPHQLSGGMRQRVMIAMALSCHPEILIADEPTTALDVTIQAQILELIIHLKKDIGMSILLITHDLGVVAETADRVVVMYAGKAVEKADTTTLFENPLHPYTWGLMKSIPKIDEEVEELQTIPGIVPNPLHFPEGCKFYNRCLLADDKCKNQEPPILTVDTDHEVRCWHYKKLDGLK